MDIYKLKLPEMVSFDRNYASGDLKASNTIVYQVPVQTEAPINIDFEWHVDRYGFQLSSSEIETFFTHRFAWKGVVDHTTACNLIIEESVEVDFNLDDVAKDIKKLPSDWDVFFPYDMYEVAKNSDENSRVTLLNDNIHEKREIEPYLLGFNWGSTIYFISRKGAEKMLQVSTIKQCVEDEMISLTQQDGLNLYYSEVEWFNISKYPPKQNIDRDLIIKDAVLNYNVWSAKAEIILASLLGRLSEVAKELSIKVLLHGGTHLSYVRHGGKMPWDDDVDLGIDEQYLDIFLNKIETTGLIIQKVIEAETNTAYYKIWSNEGKAIDGHSHRFPFIDIWIFNIRGADVVFKNGIIWPNAGLKPFVDVLFEGVWLSIPHNSLECLDVRYKDWRTKIRIYNWSHQKEAVGNHYLKAKIDVDEDGRLL